jgi:hypothetical protein
LTASKDKRNKGGMSDSTQSEFFEVQRQRPEDAELAGQWFPVHNQPERSTRSQAETVKTQWENAFPERNFRIAPWGYGPGPLPDEESDA